MANSNGPVRFSAILSTPITYVTTIAAIALTLFGAYVVHVIPQFLGLVGVTSGILGLLAFLIQDLMAEKIPTGWPVYTTFIVVSIVGALEAVIGEATSTTFVTIAAFVAWLLFIVQAVITYLNNDQGANIPISTEVQVVTLLGFLVTILTSISTSGSLATASISAASFTAGLTVTGIASLGSYVFAKETALNARRAALASRTVPVAPR